MSRLMVLIFMFGLVSSAGVFAAEGPTIEPGPVQELSVDAKTFANVLIALTKTKDNIQALEAFSDVHVDSATVQAIRPGHARYVLSGIKVQGDIALGEIKLVIDEFEQQATPETLIKIYNARVICLR